MPNNSIFDSVSAAWSSEDARGRKILDLSCGGGQPNGVVLISTPNILNMMSRVRFLFTGFLRGRVRPAHYTSKPGQAPNIYLLHFYQLYYLLFHYGFEVAAVCKTRVKFAARFFMILFWPFMCLFSFITVIRAEKDPVQRRYNWQFFPISLIQR